MPFKIISTRRKGKVELCTVPDTWENKGILRWPKMYGDILAKSDSTQPQTDWLTYNCVVKRRNYRKYEDAEHELNKMLYKTDTDDTDYGEQSCKRTIPPQKNSDFNAAAQRIMMKSRNPKKRMKQPTSTLQASPTIQASPIIQASPTIPSSPNIPASSNIQAAPTIHASPIAQAGPIIQADRTIQASPILQASPTIPANSNIQAAPTIHASPIAQAGPIIQADRTIQASPILQASPTIPANSNIQAAPTIHASPIAQAGPIIQADRTIQANPIIQTAPTIPASPTINVDPITQADPTIQRFPETSILTNQQPYIIDDIDYTISHEEQENTPQEVHYYTSNQNMITQINNIYEIQTAILDNQNKIMKKLAEMSVQLQEIQEQSTENITVTTLAQAKGEETKRMRMDLVDNIKSLEKLDKDLSCPKILKTYLEKYAILCSVAPGTGYNCAYRLLDSIFTKDFLCQCSWTGGSRGDDLKIGFKKYKNILKFFFKMVYYWDNMYTVQENEIFLKNILRNALKRKTSKNIRQSSKKRRKLQPKRSAANNNDNEDVINNDNEGNTDDGENNDGEENINNDGDGNINDADGNHDPNDEGDENTMDDGDNNTNNVGKNEAIIEE